MESTNKRKIFNDPVYGFISINYDSILDLIDHPYFQRLRRIKQLGLTSLVYPGALHTRFHHALGAMHLTSKAINVLRSKGHEITDHEAESVSMAILLHDIGHGPFSHALEHTIVDGIKHEEISTLFMQKLNQEFDGKLSTAIEIFNNQYHKTFLHQLVSSQLDMDRLDYLKRDSFYTGVHEGEVGSDRIIKMLNVHDGQLVVDEKAIYSIENFLMARRFMYWQVYLHKTVVSAEFMIVQVLKRAKELALEKGDIECSDDLKKFLYGQISGNDLKTNPEALETFARLDDFDVTSAIKQWCNYDDTILSNLCKMILNRELFKIKLYKEPVPEEVLKQIKHTVSKKYQVSETLTDNLVITGQLVNNAYDPKKDNIQLLFKYGGTLELAEASDNLNITALSKPVVKYFVCHARI